jgi:copper chaperone CopZ
MTDMHRTKLIVQQNAIHCTSCEKRIKNALNIVSGIFAVETSQSKQEVIVSYDSDRIDLERIIELLEKMGFPSLSVSSES